MPKLPPSQIAAVLTAMLIGGCTDEPSAADPSVIDPDASVDAMVDAAMLDAAPPDMADARDAQTLDAASVDMADFAVDMRPPICSPPPATAPAASGPLPAIDSPHRGVDAWEAAAWDRVRVAAQADPAVHFVATFDHAADALIIDGAGDVRVEARRVDGRWTVTAGDLADVFASTRVDLYPSLTDLFAAFEPYADGREGLGYLPNDPRVGGLPFDVQSWPHPLLRLGTLFDAEHAPDGVIGLYSWARGGGGTHGGLGLLQSRASLIVAGKGARRGQTAATAQLVDIAPTVLAALGAPTTDGVGPDGTYTDGLYLKRQDGRVLWEALAEDPCDRPRHVVVIMFDGLMANELNHQVRSPAPDVDLPTLRGLAAEGIVYQHGAVAGFPSMSAPNHMTIGTGVWPGHHGIVSNLIFDRATETRVNPFAFASDPTAFARDPAGAFAFTEVYVPAGVETLAEAAHRALGAWDADAKTGAYVAVLNDFPVDGADFSTVDFLMGERSKALGSSRLADDLATGQATTLLGTLETHPPTILHVGFASTDSAGETNGPHSPLLREVLLEMEARVARIVAAYERAGALDDTLFILTSDHGMELQDASRARGYGPVLRAADVRISEASFGMVWLRTLEAEAQPVEGGFDVVVRRHGDGAPVAEVRLTCPTCEAIATDADGRAFVGSMDGLTGTHPEYNPLQLAP